MPKYLDGAGLSRFWDNIQDQIGNASQEQVDAWLDEHPEATTTVQDGAITTVKLADSSVTDAKLVQEGGVYSDVGGIVSILNDETVNAQYTFEDGYINPSNGENMALTGFVRTVGCIRLTGKLLSVIVPNGFEIIIFRYDSNNNFLDFYGWWRGTTTRRDMTGTEFIRIAARSTTSTPITVADMDSLSVTMEPTLRAEIKKAGKDSLAPLIVGSTNVPVSVITIDTTAKTISFPSDTLIINNNGSGSAYYALSTGNNNVVCNYSSAGSSAIKVYYNKSTGALVPVPYTTVNLDMILVCAIRSSPYGSAYDNVSINAPYVLDGMLFGKDLSQFIDATPEYIVKGINHRGYNTAAPENTLPAFRLSKRYGFKYVETDVAFTSDNVAVLLHDETVDRTSDGTGNISQLTYAYVSSLDFGSWFSSAYAGTRIPTLDEFLTLCRNLSLHPYLELKSVGAYTQAQITSVVDMVKSHGMQGNVTYISFTSTYLEWVKARDPNARLGFLSNYGSSDDMQAAVALKNNQNDVFVDIMTSSATSEVVASCISNDLPLEVWVSNTASQIQGLDPYVTGITSDNLDAGAVLYNYAKA